MGIRARLIPRVVRLVAASVIVAAPPVILAPAAASAGQWMQAFCANPDGSVAPFDGFVPSTTGQRATATVYSMDGMCFLYVDATSQGSGGTAAWTYSAPPGSSIVGEEMKYGFVGRSDGWAQITTSGPSGNWLIDGSCVATFPGGTGTCLDGNTPTTPQLPSSTFPATSVEFLANCTSSCVGNLGDASAKLNSAELLLSSDAQPTGSAFGGNLLSPDAHGTADLSFMTSDPGGPGVYQVTVLIDGKVVYQGTPNTNGGKCVTYGTDSSSGAPVFDFQQPCLASESVDLPISTVGLADGSHELKVNVTDAAQNTSTVLDTPISTKQPVRSGPLYAFRLGAGSERLVNRTMRTSYRHSGFEFSGIVLAPSGAPASGVEVIARARSAAGGGFSTIARVTSDGTGRFSLLVPRGSSRVVDLAAGAGVVAVKEVVAPNLSLKVQSRSGHRLVFTGRLWISPLGNPRPLVTIVDRTSTGWQELGTVRVSPRGAFRYVYTASRQLTGYRFSFRARTPATDSWNAGSSATRMALVR
jgi:hypothetical protein